jgi:cyclopropane-fatty-acyl-phospholipid synthase
VPDGVIVSAFAGWCASVWSRSMPATPVASGRVEAFLFHGQAPIALLPRGQRTAPGSADFCALALGRHQVQRVYCAHVQHLDAAEAEALATTCARAGLGNGMDILELGCGWGSLTLWMATHYPGSRITAVSNSASQREHILAEAARRGLGNVSVITRDMNTFDTEARFDRVVSVEMFEHMRNWRELFGRVHGWLRPGGQFFLHVFVHRAVPYAFDARDASDWMSAHFFSGGMMPSDDLALRFQDRLQLVQRWRWSGTHYEKTANAWLANVDARRDEVCRCWPPPGAPARAVTAWRIFFMACAELFGYDGGQQWWVSHYLFERPAARVAQ